MGANTRPLRLLKLLALFQPSVLRLVQCRLCGLSAFSMPTSRFFVGWKWMWVGDGLASLVVDGTLVVLGVLRHRDLHEALDAMNPAVRPINRPRCLQTTPSGRVFARAHAVTPLVVVVLSAFAAGFDVQSLALAINAVAILVNAVQITSALYCEPYGLMFESMMVSRLSLSGAPKYTPHLLAAFAEGEFFMHML